MTGVGHHLRQLRNRSLRLSAVKASENPGSAGEVVSATTMVGGRRSHVGKTIEQGSSTGNVKGKYLAAVGFLAALPIFNQIDIGTNFSLLWGLIPLTVMFSKFRIPNWKQEALILFLFVFLLKFTIVSNFESALRYITYVVVILAMSIAFNRDAYDRFFVGFDKGILLNIIFASIQMAGKLTHAWDLTLDVSQWNSHLWQSNPMGGMFTSFPRVSGFTNEPAYLGTLILTAAMYRFFVQGRASSVRYHLLIFFGIVFLVNSRTAFAGYLVLMGFLFLLRITPKGLGLIFSRLIFVASFVVLPVAIVLNAGDNVNYNAMMLEDVSVFARSAPLMWIREVNNLSIWDYLFGVPSYKIFAVGVSMPRTAYTVLGLQGGFLDSKSLGGAYFYDLGLIGLSTFIAILFFALKDNARALLMFSLINVVYFNFYAFSWPLFWVVAGCCYASAMGAARRQVPASNAELRSFHRPMRRFST